MGGYPPHGPGPGGVPITGGAVISGVAPATVGRQEVGVHLVGGGKSVGGV